MAKQGSIRDPRVLRAQLHYGAPLFGYVLAFSLIAVTGVARLALVDRGYRTRQGQPAERRSLPL